MKKSKRTWRAEVKYKMALREITGAAIAAETGYTVNYIYHALGGGNASPKVVKAISDFLGIEPYGE